MRRWALPQPAAHGDKDERGRVLIIAGSAEMPGAAVLSATAAMRAGAGKLQIATTRSAGESVAAALLEARVIALPQTRGGGFALAAAARLQELAMKTDAVLIGPGMMDDRALAALLRRLLPKLTKPVVVLDAAAITCNLRPEEFSSLAMHAIFTPHYGEMAALLELKETAVARDPKQHAQKAAAMLRGIVVLKGAETIIAAPDGRCFRNQAGNVGLATSGSGDVLAGIITGLAARGASAIQSAIWGVSLHARAGERAALRKGPIGFMARELPDEVPSLMAELARR